MAPRNESGAAAEAPEAATAKPDAAEDRAADAPALFSQRGGAQAKLHVLLVEDDQATMVFVKALLKSCGHKGARAPSFRRRRALARARAASNDERGRYPRLARDDDVGSEGRKWRFPRIELDRQRTRGLSSPRL